MDVKFWTKKLKEAERELDAAARLSDVNAAAKRYMLAKTELKRPRENRAAETIGWQAQHAAVKIVADVAGSVLLDSGRAAVAGYRRSGP